LIFLENIDVNQMPVASQIPIFMWNLVWKDFFNKIFLVIGKDFKKFHYKMIINKIFEDKPQEINQLEGWMGYLHIGQHFYSVCENRK
jgi:hypothetical protein